MVRNRPGRQAGPAPLSYKQMKKQDWVLDISKGDFGSSGKDGLEGGEGGSRERDG